MYRFINKYKKYIILFIFTLITCFPLFTDTLHLGHDTLFHLSRIEGLATSINHLDLIPTIYPFKNANYGYASALFYCDILLYPFAILYLLNIDIVICFKLCIIFYTFITSITSYNLIFHISKNKYASYLGSLLYLCASYRLSNIYVRGALGEIISFAFLPIVLLAIYKLFYNNEKATKELVIGFSFLILSHNISFALACLLFLIFIILNISKLKYHIKDIIKAILLVSAFTAFFTFPMLEQLSSQEFFLETNTSWFYKSAITFDRLFSNKLVIGDDNYKTLLTPGILLLILPIINLLFKPTKFIKHSLFICIPLIIITLGIIPLEMLSIFEITQFVWRMMMLVCCLLIAPATVPLFTSYKHSYKIFILLSSLTIANTIYLLSACLLPNTSILNNTKYSSLIDGSIINPYYSAFYVRVELAGGDYLPTGCIDYQNYKYGIYNKDNMLINTPINKDYNINFELNNPDDSIIIPKTYYKGYNIYHIVDNKYIKLPTYQDPNTKLVRFDTLNTTGKYILKYDHTPTQLTSYFITFSSLFILCLTKYTKHSKKLLKRI